MKLKSFLSYAAAAIFVLNLTAHTVRSASTADLDADYDRLDGTGKSGKRVDVIEWDSNLEIHVYPKGSTAGLGMKLDEKNGKKVMVIAYRFVENPNQVLTRRNILGIPLVSGFKVYKDPMENDFDKFIISNNGLSGQVLAYKLDPTPTQLYPEGTPALAKSNTDGSRKPASVSQPADTTEDAAPSGPDDSGSLQPFFMGGDRMPSRSR